MFLTARPDKVIGYCDSERPFCRGYVQLPCLRTPR